MAIPAEFGVPDGALESRVVENVPDRVRAVEEDLLREIEALGCSEEDAFGIRLALEEALVNAIRHGNGNDPAKQVELRYFLSAERIILAVVDEGVGFSPERIPDPTLDENLEKPHGRGLMLMRAYMSEIRFNERGNEVWMLKNLNEASDE